MPTRATAAMPMMSNWVVPKDCPTSALEPRMMLVWGHRAVSFGPRHLGNAGKTRAFPLQRTD
jgi:hypothetical protein